MAITAIDKKTALVIIDLQKGIVGMPVVHPVKGVIENAAKLVKAFKAASLPVIAVNVNFSADWADALRPRVDYVLNFTPPAGWHELVPELGLDANDIRITKRNWNAFYGTELELQLRRRGITNIVLAGISTSIGVEGTARAAYEQGFNISFALDAMTDTILSAHENSVNTIFPRIGEVGATEDIIKHL